MGSMMPAIGKCNNIPGFDDILTEYIKTKFSDSAIIKPNSTEPATIKPSY